MPVPKRKTSKSRRDKRQSCKFIRPKAFTACGNCNEPVGTHQMCRGCGFYKGRKIVVTRQDRLVARGEKKAVLNAKNNQQQDQQPEGRSE